MHRGLVDKKRRRLNLSEPQVKQVLPSHFVSSYPKFISLLERYYEYEDENDTTELLKHLFASRDITETDLTLLSFIEDELLLGQSYIDGFPDKRAAANFSSVLFRAKGSKYSIEWFFRSFYGLDPEIIYPKENVFVLNDPASQIGADSLHYITNDKLYQTFSLLIKVGKSISEWRDLFKLFVHPAGMYLAGEVLIVGKASLEDFTNQPDPGVADHYPWGSGTTETPVLSDEQVAYGELISRFNTAPTSSLSASPSLANEGDTVTFTFTSNDLPDPNGSVWFFIQNGTTNNSDFTATPPSSANREEMTLVNGSGNTSVTIATDSATEGDEVFYAFVYDSQTGGDKLAEVLVTIVDQTVSSDGYSIAVSQVIEGQNLIFTIQPIGTPANENVNWSISGSGVTNRIDPGDLSGVEIAVNSNRQVTVPTTELFNWQGIQTGTIQIEGVTSGNSANVNFTMVDAAPTIQISGSTTLYDGTTQSASTTMDVYPLYSTNSYTVFTPSSRSSVGACAAEGFLFVEETGGDVIVYAAGETFNDILSGDAWYYHVEGSTQNVGQNLISGSDYSNKVECFRISGIGDGTWSVKSSFGDVLDTWDDLVSIGGVLNVPTESEYTNAHNDYGLITSTPQLISSGTNSQRGLWFYTSANAATIGELDFVNTGSIRLTFSKSGQDDIFVDVIWRFELSYAPP